MNLYQTQHPFYCGIDLRANEMYACVVDQSGKKLLHFKPQNSPTRKTLRTPPTLRQRNHRRRRINLQLVLAVRRLRREESPLDPNWTAPLS